MATDINIGDGLAIQDTLATPGDNAVFNVTLNAGHVYDFWVSPVAGGLTDVSQRIGLPGLWYAGSHGFELTAPDGTHHQNDAAAAAIPVLETAATQLREQLGSIAGVAVEHKRFGVAVHYRNAARDRFDSLELNLAITAMPDKEERIVARRLEEFEANMRAT